MKYLILVLTLTALNCANVSEKEEAAESFKAVNADAPETVNEPETVADADEADEADEVVEEEAVEPEPFTATKTKLVCQTKYSPYYRMHHYCYDIDFETLEEATQEAEDRAEYMAEGKAVGGLYESSCKLVEFTETKCSQALDIVGPGGQALRFHKYYPAITTTPFYLRKTYEHLSEKYYTSNSYFK